MAEVKKVVWITGGGSGLGEAMAHEFARRGYFVAISGRRLDALERVQKAIGPLAMAVQCDVLDEPSVKQAVERVVAEQGRLDIVVANAGYAANGKIVEVSAEDWTRQLGVNVVGAATTVRIAYPHLMNTKGRIALIASVASQVNSPRNGAYNASKAALRAMGLTLAMECHKDGISCTTIHPGFVESEIGQVDNEGVFHEEWEDRRPSSLMWPADKAARVMVRAIERRKLECVFTGHGIVGAWLGRHVPWLVHFLVTRKVIRI